jgi:hypothetical protein
MSAEDLRTLTLAYDEDKRMERVMLDFGVPVILELRLRIQERERALEYAILTAEMASA